VQSVESASHKPLPAGTPEAGQAQGQAEPRPTPIWERAWATASTWLRGSRLGLAVMALAVGVGAGLGAVAFRWLIYGFTWLATGHLQFGQQGRVASIHLPWLGIWFVLAMPVLGGLIYGPLIQRFAREARGHGVPEVMLAVAENGGRIRPPVTVVKALASALCIGTGGSVGREGPIVQIGSALASTLGQAVRMSETRLRVIVACGAAGGIAATFNAPLTGMFFGFEIVLREFSFDAIFATILSAVTADLISRAFFGSGPFFSGMPHDLFVKGDSTYILIAVLGALAGLTGYGFKTVLYKAEDLVDRLWKGRPEWARPATGGVALGLLLLALPQMYGVGYPVMDNATAGRVVVWMLVVLMFGKVVAASLTLAIGGSGGVFAPSLFTGAMGGMAFGIAAKHLFPHLATSPAVFATIAMGAVFGAAAQAPLTSIASVVEMTGNFGLTLPIMLATGIAAAISKRLSYGSIYTTKLLRRGIDIERPKPANILQLLTVADVMKPFSKPFGLTYRPRARPGEDSTRPSGDSTGPSEGSAQVAPASAVAPANAETWAKVAGPVAHTRQPHPLLEHESLEQALRQLSLYGLVGLPVLSPDRQHLVGWVTRQDVLRAMAEHLRSAPAEAAEGAYASSFGAPDAEAAATQAKNPIAGYEIVEVLIGHGSPALGRPLGEVAWPPGSIPVAVVERREIVAPAPEAKLAPGERVVLLAPTRPGGPPSETTPALHQGPFCPPQGQVGETRLRS
jgi:CIC family chloride channel protein